MKSSELAQSALSRARGGQSMANLPAVYSGFLDMGIAESEILPRVNVLSFHAWRALGRTVRKGQHGVKLVTWIEAKDAKTGETYKKPHTVTVFHVSQTDALH